MISRVLLYLNYWVRKMCALVFVCLSGKCAFQQHWGRCGVCTKNKLSFIRLTELHVGHYRLQRVFKETKDKDEEVMVFV